MNSISITVVTQELKGNKTFSGDEKLKEVVASRPKETIKERILERQERDDGEGRNIDAYNNRLSFSS